MKEGEITSEIRCQDKEHIRETGERQQIIRNKEKRGLIEIHSVGYKSIKYRIKTMDFFTRMVSHMVLPKDKLSNMK